MQGQLRVGPLDGGERILVPLNAEFRGMAALQHDLGCAEFDGFSTSANNLIDGMRPALVVSRWAVESAELARSYADVRVVDVAVDDVRRDVVRVPPPAYRIGGLSQPVQRRVGIEIQRLIGTEAATVRCTLEQPRSLSWHSAQGTADRYKESRQATHRRNPPRS